jgi:amino acid permease
MLYKTTEIELHADVFIDLFYGVLSFFYSIFLTYKNQHLLSTPTMKKVRNTSPFKIASKKEKNS